MGNASQPCVCNNAPCSADETKLGESSNAQNMTEDGNLKDSLKNPYNSIVAESDTKPAEGGGEDDTVTYRDGASYSGQVLDGKRHGHGTFTSAAGEYVGQWEEDLRHGEGREAWKDGRLYTGTFRKGKIYGRGRMEWRTAQGVLAYEGEYLDDLKHGLGKFSWPDGRVYDGQWEFGKRSGEATYVSSRGITRKGVWVNDKLQKWLDGVDTKSP